MAFEKKFFTPKLLVSENNKFLHAARSTLYPLSLLGASLLLSWAFNLTLTSSIVVMVILLVLLVLANKFWSLTDPSSTVASASELAQLRLPTRLRVLNLNAFLRPPGVEHPHGDFKDLRTSHLRAILENYDIVCLQEVYCMFSLRRRALIQAAVKAGLRYFSSPPPVSLFTKRAVDSGLLILSRYPITRQDYCTYAHSAHEDVFSDKGALYAQVALSATRSVHIFTTHLQSSFRTVDAVAEAVRQLQMKQFYGFVRKCTQNDEFPIFCSGDFNIDSYSVRNRGEHLLMLKIFDGFHDLLDEATQLRGKSQQYHTVVTVFDFAGVEASSTFAMCRECHMSSLNRPGGGAGQCQGDSFLHPEVLMRYEPHLDLDLPSAEDGSQLYEYGLVTSDGVVVRDEDWMRRLSNATSPPQGPQASPMTEPPEMHVDNKHTSTNHSDHVQPEGSDSQQPRLRKSSSTGELPALRKRGGVWGGSIGRLCSPPKSRVAQDRKHAEGALTAKDGPGDHAGTLHRRRDDRKKLSSPPADPRNFLPPTDDPALQPVNILLRSATVRNLHRVALPGSFVVTPQRLDYILFNPRGGGVRALSTEVEPFLFEESVQEKTGCYRLSDHCGLSAVMEVTS